MNRDPIETRLRSVLTELLHLPPEAESLSREARPEWDSLRHVEIIFAVEEEFAVHMTREEMGKASSLAALVRIVKAHLAS